MALATSFEAYVAEHSVALQRFAYLVVRNAEDAKDLVQEALIGLYPRWHQVSARGSVDAYVRRSIVNASVSRWRKIGRIVPVADPEWHGSVPDATDRVAAADEAWRLCAALPPAQRAAVVMRFYEDRERRVASARCTWERAVASGQPRTSAISAKLRSS